MWILKVSLKIAHFLGFSALFGGILSQFAKKDKRIVPAVRIGGIVTIISGVGLYLFEGFEDGWDHINTPAFWTKMLLVATSVGLSFVSRGKPMTNRIFGAHVALMTAIIIIAVMYL